MERRRLPRAAALEVVGVEPARAVAVAARDLDVPVAGAVVEEIAPVDRAAALQVIDAGRLPSAGDARAGCPRSLNHGLPAPNGSSAITVVIK